MGTIFTSCPFHFPGFGALNQLLALGATPLVTPLYDSTSPYKTCRNFKGGIGSHFYLCFNAMGWRSYWPSCMEMSIYIVPSDLAWSFGAICAHQYCVIHHAITYIHACVIKVHAGKATHAKLNCLAGLAMKKTQRNNNSPPYVMARWPPQQIPL